MNTLKKIMFFVSITLMIESAFAQSNDLLSPLQLDSAYSMIEGKWMGEKDGKKIQMTFSKSKYYHKAANMMLEFVKGEYIYWEDGKEIINTEVKKREGLPYLFGSTHAFNENTKVHVFSMLFYDPLKNRRGSGSMLLSLNEQTDVLSWTLKSNESVVVTKKGDAPQEWDRDFSLPTEFSLRRVQ